MGGDDDEAAAGAKDPVGFGEYRWQVIEVGGGHDGGDGVRGLAGEGREGPRLRLCVPNNCGE